MEKLKEGDYTKCGKFSQWVDLHEIDEDQTFGSGDFELYRKYNGVLSFDGDLQYGEATYYIPFKTFRKRLLNTVKP